MSYTAQTDFLGLWRMTSTGVEKAMMPGLDWWVAAMGRAGLINVFVSRTPPTVNQPTTAWFMPASPSYAAEGVLFLWNGNQYVPATPDLFLRLMMFTGLGLSGLLDDYFGDEQGSIIYRDIDVWKALPPGNPGAVLTTMGLHANPIWRAITASLVANDSTAPGTTVADALSLLRDALSLLTSDDIHNASTVPGVTVTQALDALVNAINGIDNAHVHNLSNVPGATTKDALNAIYANPFAGFGYGTAGYVLTSTGPGTPPVWKSLSLAIGTSGVTNQSGVPGATATDALNYIQGEIAALQQGGSGTPSPSNRWPVGCNWVVPPFLTVNFDNSPSGTMFIVETSLVILDYIGVGQGIYYNNAGAFDRTPDTTGNGGITGRAFTQSDVAQSRSGVITGTYSAVPPVPGTWIGVNGTPDEVVMMSYNVDLTPNKKWDGSPSTQFVRIA